MKIYLLDNKQINMYSLPKKIEDSFLIKYITENGLEETINVIAREGHWEIESNPETTFFNNGMKVSKEVLENNSTYQIKFSDLQEPLLFYCFETPIKFNEYDISTGSEITIGKSQNNTIVYNNVYTNSESIKITKQNGYWFLDDNGVNQQIYINGYKSSKKVLKLGDTIFLNGLKIIWLEDHIKINTPKDQLTIALSQYKNTSQGDNKYTEPTDTEKASTLYNDSQIFFHTPRLKESIKPQQIEIQIPPLKQEEDKTPAFLQIGGTVMMGFASGITGMIAIINVATGNANIESSITEIMS